MGMLESEDLYQVISYLRFMYKINNFSLWGRSMGAVTALMYLLRYYIKNNSSGIIIDSVVLDSPFSSL